MDSPTPFLSIATAIPSSPDTSVLPTPVGDTTTTTPVDHATMTSLDDPSIQAEADTDANAIAEAAKKAVANEFDKALPDKNTTGATLTREIFASSKAIFRINDVQFCRDFTSDSPSVQSSITFRNPCKQRASLVLHVTFPRHITVDNPKKLSEHEIQLIFPVQAIVAVNYDALSPDTAVTLSTVEPRTGSREHSLIMLLGTLYILALRT
ncbi:hypothetical protein B7494_g8117 [Chlorociboria aeruginascens]|nr:hypothetical protein B7494_g8117 [Chlorociboria aeruginascens]